MKAVKPISALAMLTLVAVFIFVLVMRLQPGALWVSDVTAAPLLDHPGSVAVFLTLHNTGDADRLTAVRSIVAQRARLEGSRADAGLAIPAASKTALAADGAFILLDGVGGTLPPGRMLPITLRFANAEEIRSQARLGPPMARGTAAAAGHIGLGDVMVVPPGDPKPGLTLRVRPEGAGWTVQVTTRDFTFSEETGMAPHVPGTGHGHLYLGGLKLQRLYKPGARIGALPPGRHEIRVTLNTNDHRAYVVDGKPVTATAVISVP